MRRSKSLFATFGRAAFLVSILFYFAPFASAGSPRVVAIESSPPLDTTYPSGLGPRNPRPYTSKKALEAPPAIQFFGPKNVVDRQKSKPWVPKEEGADGWIKLVFDEERFVESLTMEGYGRLNSEDPKQNNRIRRATVAPPASAIDLPPLELLFQDTLSPQSHSIGGRAMEALTLSIEGVYPGPSNRSPISALKVTFLPLSVEAVKSLLDLPEGSAVSAVKSPLGGGQYIVAWSAKINGQNTAELVGISGNGPRLRVAWREKVRLQFLTSSSIELIPTVVSRLGFPALLLTYRFIDPGSTLTYARIYAIAGSGPRTAWETVISRGESQEKRSLQFSPGHIAIQRYDPERGFAMVQERFRYDPAYRQFEPAPLQTPGVRATVRSASGQNLSGSAALLDQNPSTALKVAGHGEGTVIRIQFNPPRQLASLQLFPGTTGRAQGVTRPAKITLSWPSGFTLDAELDDALELQTLFEGWEGQAAAKTPWVDVTITEVYPGIPGRSMAIGDITAWFLDEP